MAARGASRRQVTLAALGVIASASAARPAAALAGPSPAFAIDPGRRQAWLAAWQASILAEARTRYCDTAMGEEVGWLISPFLEGFYQGYLATGDARWLGRLGDWADAWIGRSVTEPDGYPGWPKLGAAGTDVDDLNSYDADSLLGEAMALRPVVLAAAAVLRHPALAAQDGARARGWLDLARRIDAKWQSRGAWRATAKGTISVVLPYGIDPRTGGWAGGWQRRNDPEAGFSHPDNKANLVARWLLAMADATGEVAYRERAAAWFGLMASRLQRQADGTIRIWNYWEPAGPWDYRLPGVPKHWVGVHPNAGYYDIDVGAMVAACEHGVVFTAKDLEALIRTAQATGRQWSALAPYDATLRARFEATLQPQGWGALSLVPWYLAASGGAPG